MLENNWSNPFSNQPVDLLNLTTGAAATPAVTKDLLSAHTKGEEASKIHMEKANLPPHSVDRFLSNFA